MFKTIKVSIIIVIISLLTSCSGLSITPHHIEFLDKPCIKPLKDYKYVLGKSVEVQIDDVAITIPKGFETDLASIPRWYWSILSPNNTSLVAPAILHDYLYACETYFTQKESDDIFYMAMIEGNVSPSTAYQMYLAVRLFGKKHYHKNMKCPPPSSMD